MRAGVTRTRCCGNRDAGVVAAHHGGSDGRVAVSMARTVCHARLHCQVRSHVGVGTTLQRCRGGCRTTRSASPSPTRPPRPHPPRSVSRSSWSSSPSSLGDRCGRAAGESDRHAPGSTSAGAAAASARPTKVGAAAWAIDVHAAERRLHGEHDRLLQPRADLRVYTAASRNAPVACTKHSPRPWPRVATVATPVPRCRCRLLQTVRPQTFTRKCRVQLPPTGSSAGGFRRCQPARPAETQRR